MHPILNLNQFFIKEHIGILKAANNFDIYNRENQDIIMTCREENLGLFTKLFRFSKYKKMTPFHIEIKTASGDKVLTIKRGIAIFLSTVEVFDEKDKLVGKFKQKFFSIGGKFEVLDVNENMLCILKGKWTNWDFKFINNDTEFAHVSKKWVGIGKEFFTSADNYMLEINQNLTPENPIRLLILAAVMCIDMVLKE